MQSRVEEIAECPLDKQPARRIYTSLPDRMHYTQEAIILTGATLVSWLG